MKTNSITIPLGIHGNQGCPSAFANDMFGTLRIVVTDDQKPMFNLTDVCRALTLSTPAKVKQRLSERGMNSIHTPTQNQFGATVMQPMTYIDEANLYRCIFQSRKAEAEKFQSWVFEDVLPQIRQTGGYIPTRNARTGELLSNSEIIQRANHIIGRTIATRNLPAEGCFTMTDIAKGIGLDVKDLNHYLVDKGIIRWAGGRYQMTPSYADQGYDESRLFCYHSKEGEAKQRTYLVWTAAGKAMIEKMFNQTIH
jgi:prophage antirepressor-like protein